MKSIAETKRWTRNVSDELAVANGCWFDEARGQEVVDWIERYCRLYEGEWAGQPMRVLVWGYDATMRLFGWQKQSERWSRSIRRFRQGVFFVPKKNKKSPLLAAWGLYLLVGDGEPGQKVYFGASDGAQAREISGKHAVEMVLASEDLQAECTINKSLMQITHEASRSIMKPISSVDSRAQKSKEGLNGCILIDETHVVDEAFMGRVSQAGISRSEPLQIEVSTGRRQSRKLRPAKQAMNTVSKLRPAFSPMRRCCSPLWEAPQDLTDADLALDPVKYGRMANPAWGHTIGEEEFLADYNSSKTSLTNYLRFKMYRLNIWQSASNPWLDMGDWRKNRRDYTEQDLLGEVCFGGLDLSKSGDTTALILLFPQNDGSYRQLAYFWLPRDRAENLRDRVHYLEWAEDGDITLIDGAVIVQQLVEDKILELQRKFIIQSLAYDPYFATDLITRLEVNHGIPHEQLLEFKQTMPNFTAATVHYVELLKRSSLNHNGNAILTWQAGNVHVSPDKYDNIRPLKQRPGRVIARSTALCRQSWP